MRILISNDDGVNAPGIAALYQALADYAECVVIAPAEDRSGASSALTLDRPLHPMALANGYISLNGTPTDCVHLAISGLFEDEHDMVVSGVNDGANLGDDVLYSGTVAAAIEGRFLGLPTIAVSLCTQPESGRHFADAARVARELVMHLVKSPLHASTILNVNVPDLPYEELRGVRATRLGNRHRSERVVRSQDPRGRAAATNAK